MKKISILIPVLVALILISAVLNTIASDNDTANTEKIERGRYLVTIGGCGDCHSPKMMTKLGPVEDTTRLLSGHPSNEYIRQIPENLGKDGWLASCNKHLTAWAGPWGISFASNLTSDKETGIGNWKDNQFIQAMRTGKHRGFGRPILPPMPWANLAKATDEDLSAMLAYLLSTKPIANKVPEPYPLKQEMQKQEN